MSSERATIRPPPSASGFGLRFVWLTLSFVLAARRLPAAEDRIPELRPPRGSLLPSFWEQHAWVIVTGAILLLAGVALAWWLARRPRPSAPSAPELDAQRALAAMRGHPEDVGLTTAVARELRRYVLAVAEIPNEELTTEELLSVIRSRFPAVPELTAAATQLLVRCDQAKFAPVRPHPEGSLVERALEFVQRLESVRPRPAALERKEVEPAPPPAP